MPRRKKEKLIGLGLPANLLKEFIDLSYKGNTSIAPEGYEIDAPLSDSRVKVYKKIGSNQVIIVHRGSVGLQDWYDNAKFFVAGNVKNTKSFKLHQERQRKAVEKYGGENMIGVGHSRAGLYLQQLQKDPETKLDEIITYNKAVGFYDALRTNVDEQTDVKVKNDFVSLLSGLQKRKNKMVEIDATSNPLDFNKAHQAEEISKLGDTFIGKKEEEKLEGSGRAPSTKTLEELQKNLKTLEKQLINIEKGKVYKTTNKEKVSYEISYTKARIKNHETKGEDLIITKKEKYKDELPAKAKPYKAKPKKEPKPKPEPKKEEGKLDFLKLGENYTKMDFSTAINNYIRTNNLQTKTNEREFRIDKNLSKLFNIEENKLITYFQSATLFKPTINELFKEEPKPKQEPKKEEPKPEPKKEEPKKEEPKPKEVTSPKLAKIEEFINDTENYLNKKSTRAFNSLMKKYNDKDFIKAILGAQKFNDFYPTSQKCLSNYSSYLKNNFYENEVILEPTAGLGSIVLWLLKNNVKSKIIATDYNQDINKYLKESFDGIEQVRILDHAKSDYLDMKNEYYKYNPSYIFLNPPFSNKGDKKYYLNFLFKALYDLRKSKTPFREHQLFFISPQLTNKNEKNDQVINFEDIPISKNKKEEIKKMLNINEDEWEELTPTQILKVNTCKDFGGTNTEAVLYHILMFGDEEEEPKKEDLPVLEEPNINIVLFKMKDMDFSKMSKPDLIKYYKKISPNHKIESGEQYSKPKIRQMINRRITNHFEKMKGGHFWDSKEVKEEKRARRKANAEAREAKIKKDKEDWDNKLIALTERIKKKRKAKGETAPKAEDDTQMAKAEDNTQMAMEEGEQAIEGGIFGFSAEEKARKQEYKDKKAAYAKEHHGSTSGYVFSKSTRKKFDKEYYAKKNKAQQDETAPKAIESAQQGVNEDAIQQGAEAEDQEALGSGFYYLKEIAEPTNPIFRYKKTYEIPTFIDPETEFLSSLKGGAFTDMAGMNCDKTTGQCFNPVWEKEKIKKQILSEYKIWYNPFKRAPPGTILMAWLPKMIEDRYKPLYDEFVARRNVNIGLPADASRERFEKQMFSNLTDGLSYVPIFNTATSLGLTAASTLTDTKKEDGT